MLQNPASYQPFAPTLIGRGAPEFLVGALIGRHGLLFVLESQGVIPTSKELDVLIGIVKDRVRSNGNNLSFADVTQLYLQHC